MTYTFTGAMPTAVATRIGTGAFTQATVASGKVSISVPSGTSNYSIAWVCPPISRPDLPVNDENVIHASVKDGTSFSWYCDDNGSNETSGTATLQVDASAISGGASVTATDGVGDNQASIAQIWSSGTLNLSGQMITGTYDVFVTVNDANFNILAVKILRDQTIPGTLNGGSPVVFTASDETTTQTLTVSNIPSGFSPSDTFIAYETAELGNALSLNSPFLAQPNQYTAFPSSTIQSGDYYWFDAGANGVGNEYVGVHMDMSSNNPPAVTLPAPWAYTGPSPAVLPTFNIDYSKFSGMADVVLQADIEWGNGTKTVNEIYPAYSIQISATANYLNGATSITVPDLSGLAGFIAPAPSGANVIWFANTEQGFPLLSSPTNGTMSIVEDAGLYIEP
ncbi:MAG: hypothetical protein ABR907_07495 [Terracidiphilus sp.]